MCCPWRRALSRGGFRHRAARHFGHGLWRLPSLRRLAEGAAGSEEQRALLARLSAAGAAFLEPLGPLGEAAPLLRSGTGGDVLDARAALSNRSLGDRYFAVTARGTIFSEVHDLALAHRLLRWLRPWEGIGKALGRSQDGDLLSHKGVP